ncbi:TonB family protein [Methylovulum miyakonense]|uniref:TonB family protein n=1 Tax=Methylovulum miyakonense TaxID=645578 RepID=UPI00036639C0|nr:TonB family protein [Methylovulum miyakonense]
MTRLKSGIKTFVFDSRFKLLCLTLSLVLHTFIVIGVFAKKRSKPPQHEELVVQLVGMVNTRQVEQKQRGETNPDTAQKAAAPLPQKAAKKAPEKEKKPIRKVRVKEKAKPEPKLEPKQEEKQALKQPSERQTLQPAQPVSGMAVPAGAESQQIQQTIKPRESEANLIRKYLAVLKRDIQNHLDYPEEARDTGNVGAPTIRFTITENGNILLGSLSISKSSGSIQLDQQALRAARDAAPMAKPPRQMTVTIKVVFTQDGVI